ncbi:MAG: prephenate dehydratase [Actinobacteria bacterium]|nr:prephenate dehydratase [Actinomycetota bacterium]MBU4449851.1 prephenate dehydratase [Actinomycetota bacterium]MCG2789789.1 prephenate dehydratase [Actinomycetes bacterium]
MDNKKIAFLGPEGTFTEEALIKYIKDLKEYEKMPISTIQDVIKSVDRGEVWQGVVPIENSIEGSVNITQDILTFESDAKIIGEITIPIKHHLIGKKGTKIKNVKKILSHPHATAQCRIFLASKCSDCEIIAANSTAEAVKKLLGSESDTAAIGTKIAAGIYDLEILSRDIEDNKENKTRFVIIGNIIPPKTGNDKTSIVCFLKKDKPGSLFNILKEFAKRNINLTRLESRPAKKDLGDYVFMIDMEGHIHDKTIYEAIESLRNKVYLVKILGSYPVSKGGLTSD